MFLFYTRNMHMCPVHTRTYIVLPVYAHLYRCMGHFIRFIHNRDLAAENIMTAYCRSSLIRDCFPGTVKSLLEKIVRSGYHLPKRSMLTSADELIRLRGDVPGEFGMTLSTARRNIKIITAGQPLIRAVRRHLQRVGLLLESNVCEERISGQFLDVIPVCLAVIPV
jgi:hypothetical protein